MKLHASLADMIHMSRISSNLFLFLPLTWICVGTAVLPVVLPLLGARQGQGRHPGIPSPEPSLPSPEPSLLPSHPSSRQRSFSSTIPVNCLLSQSHSRTACKSSSSSHSFRFKSWCSVLCKARGEGSGGISGSPQPRGCRRIFCQFGISLLWCVSVPVWSSGIALVPTLCTSLSGRFMKWYFQGVKHYLSQVLWSIDNKWDKHWVVKYLKHDLWNRDICGLFHLC